MANRGSWKFSYTADKLLDAAKKKLEWHTARKVWWTNKKEEVMTTIKAEGLEIDESVAFKMSSNYNRNTTVNIRNDLLKDLDECVGKMDEHAHKIKDYDAWVQVLGSQGQASLDLYQDDWLFFFGK